ncbi:hypothetical protein H5V44_02020 [Halobellus sp. MBLA0160]|uniref:Uncharacterized protein n=2 Tax=Halobellus ruber TaxID=2761102 RepID=A0A7J9SGJ9_9EURY|nr:hypothetical protein [Halobellus ruber]
MNRTVGVNQDHLWFFGTDQDYWNSDVQYKRPGEIEQSSGGMLRGGGGYDAGETTISQMVRQLDLKERDRICYLFDYGDEWRFYAIVKEIDGERSSGTEPEVVNKGRARGAVSTARQWLVANSLGAGCYRTVNIQSPDRLGLLKTGELPTASERSERAGQEPTDGRLAGF